MPGRKPTDDAGVWQQHAQHQNLRAHNGGLGRQAPSRFKSCRKWTAAVFFATGYGLALWNAGFLGEHEHTTGNVEIGVWAGCALSFVLFGLMVTWQVKKGEIFVASAGGAQEGECCGIKWSSLFGYIGLLAIIMLLVGLPFWVGKELISCLAGSHPDRDCLSAAKDVTFNTAAVFTALAVLLSAREILKHWLNYFAPERQRHAVRVLLMVPLYALDAYFTLWLCFGRKGDDGKPQGCEESWLKLFAETLREFYEAYTIYSFLTYLIECLHYEAVEREKEAEDRSAEGLRKQMEGVGGAPPAAAEAEPEPEPQPAGSEATDAPLLAARTAPQRRSSSLGGASMIQSQGDGRPYWNPEAMYRLLRETNPDGMKHSWGWGMGWMKEWQMGEEWLGNCWQGVLQYVVLQVLFALTVLITTMAGIYGEGCMLPWSWNNDIPTCGADPTKTTRDTCPRNWTGVGSCSEEVDDTHIVSDIDCSQVAGAEWTPLYHEYRCYKTAYPWTTLIISLSQMYALYCLVHFYHGTDKPLKQIKPFAKFISIKLIVFFSYWQGIILNAMNGNGMLDWVAVNSHLCEADKTDPDKCDAFGGSESISVGIQAVLICIEMFVAALAHRGVFSYRDYQERLTQEPELGFLEAAKHSCDQSVIQKVAHDYVRNEVGVVRAAVDGLEAGGRAVGRAAETVEDHVIGGDRLVSAGTPRSDASV